MTPYYAEDGIALYCGDCLEVLPALEIDAKGGREARAKREAQS